MNLCVFRKKCFTGNPPLALSTEDKTVRHLWSPLRRGAGGLTQ